MFLKCLVTFLRLRKREIKGIFQTYCNPAEDCDTVCAIISDHCLALRRSFNKAGGEGAFWDGSWITTWTLQSMIFSFPWDTTLRWSAFLSYWLIVLVQDEDKAIWVATWRGILRTTTEENGLSCLSVVYISFPQGWDIRPHTWIVST